VSSHKTWLGGKFNAQPQETSDKASVLIRNNLLKVESD